MRTLESAFNYLEQHTEISDVILSGGDPLMLTDTMLEKILARHTGQPEDRVRLDIERDTILTAEQAKEYGFIDDVITTRKLSSLNVG